MKIKQILSRLSKSGSYIGSWKVGGIVNRRIKSWIIRSYIIKEKNKKIHINMLNNNMNHTFIDIIMLIITFIYKHHLKRP